MPTDPPAYVPQPGPYTARTYDGTTPEKSFKWNTPEGQAAAPFAAAFSTLLTLIRNTLAMEDQSASQGMHLLQVLVAKGYDSLDSIPPLPLPGEHADVKGQILAKGMAFWIWMETALNSPQTVTVQTSAGPVQVTDVPLTVFRQLMPAGAVR